MSTALSVIESKLDVLRKKYAAIGGQITKLCNIKDKILVNRDREIIKNIPDKITDINAKQWKWILYTDDYETTVHHQIKNLILNKMGFGAFGFYSESNQPIITIWENGLDPNKIKNNFKLLKPHLKPITVKDGTTETGISIQATGLVSDTTSVLYVHKEGEVALYEDKWDDARIFKSFNDFIDFYAKEIKYKGRYSND